jgi:hypothetical protein
MHRMRRGKFISFAATASELPNGAGERMKV